jgi:NDP-sugar pyrophosphorylase family protein
MTVCGKTLLEHTIVSLADAGFTNIAVVVSPREEEPSGIRKTLSELPSSVTLTWVVQPEPVGAHDAVLRAFEQLGRPEKVVLASSYHVAIGTTLAAMTRVVGKPNVISLRKTDEPWLYGIAELNGQDVVGIEEKPAPGTEKSEYKMQSIYLLSRDFLEELEQKANAAEDEYLFESFLGQAAADGKVAAYFNTEELPSLKFAWHLFEFFNTLMPRFTTDIHPGAFVAESAVIDTSGGPVVIEKGAIIGHAAKIVGPCYIGKDVLIGDFSFVRQSSIEAGAVVGANTEIVRSLIMERSSIHYSYLADSILGRGVKVGAGLITANKRLDRQPVATMIKGKMVNTQRPALGMIAGHGAQVGIRVSTMPGVCLGSQSVVYPGLTVSKNVDHQASVQEQQETK